MVSSKDSQNTGAGAGPSSSANDASNSRSDPADTWVELESDPGLFTLLIEDFGVRGVQVEEIYDLNSPSSLESTTVYGFIFLFKWVESGRRGRGASIATSTAGTTVTDENVVNSMFFAQQIVTNACATHALLSILLNCDETIELGTVLTEFKEHTYGMTPEAKGNAVGKSAALAWAHNKHARPDARRQMERDLAAVENPPARGKKVRRYRWTSQEQFHFIGYLPINGRLYELDGLKSHPVDHGETPPGILWTQHFQSVISERIELINSILDANEIRYNLMALVPSKLHQLNRSLVTLKLNRQLLCNGLEKLLEATDPKILDVARQRAEKKPSSDAEAGSSRRKKSRLTDAHIDVDALIEAAEGLPPSSQQATDLTGPLTVTTSAGIESVVDAGVSSGDDIDQCPFGCVISAVDVVTVIGRERHNTAANATTSIECLDESANPDDHDDNERMDIDEETTKSSDVVVIKSDMDMTEGSDASIVIVKHDVQKTEEVVEDEEKKQKPQSSDNRSAMVIKLEMTTGSRGCILLGPLGVVRYVRRIQEQIELVDRLAADEVLGRQQWEIDDERRTREYDQFIQTFLSLLVKESVYTPVEVGAKNGKTKARRESRGGSAKGRKRR